MGFYNFIPILLLKVKNVKVDGIAAPLKTEKSTHAAVEVEGQLVLSTSTHTDLRAM